MYKEGKKKIKSMTGFGRSFVQASGIQVTVEILAVNRKHLDINLALPRHMNRFDPEIRKQLGQAIQRGHVTVRIGVVFTEEAPLSVEPNLALAKQYFQAWKQAASALGVKQEVPLELLQNESDLFMYKETGKMEELGPLFARGIEEALKPFMAMREAEGSVLKHDIAERLKLAKQQMALIREMAPRAEEKYQKKILEKVRSWLPLTEATDERLLKEVALFAEKVDVTEEIVRFESHIEQFHDLLEKGPDAAGKGLEFIVQELGREINTIGSKCSDIEVTKGVLAIKTELERVREQIQNIE